MSKLGFRAGRFPSGFDWAAFLKKSRIARATRWAALDALVDAPEVHVGDIELTSENPTDFLTALALALADRAPAQAAVLFERAARLSRLTPEQIEDWGRVLARLERWPEAAACFLATLGAGAAQPVTVAAAGHALIESGEPEAALRAIASPLYHPAGDYRLREVTAGATEALFRQAWAEAQTLYEIGARAQADSVFSNVVADIASWWTKLDPIGLPLRQETADRYVLLANVDLRQCTHYRVKQKEQIFARAGLKLEVYEQARVDDFITALPGARAAIFYRIPAFPKNIRALCYCQALGIESYYDVDDLIFDSRYYPEPIETYGGLVDKGFYVSLQMGVPLFRAAMSMCDAGIASTRYLAGYMREIVRTGKCHILPNGLDANNEPFMLESLPRMRRRDDIVLFYGSGTKAHNADFISLVGEPLVDLMKGNPKIKLVIMGYLTLDESFDDVKSQVIQMEWSKSVEAYWSVLAEADINMAVLLPSPTTDGKSEIKWLEAAALGVASVVSRTETFRGALEHGHDCLMAATTQEWRQSLEALVGDARLRSTIVAGARETARRNYSLDANADRLKSMLATTAASSPAKDRSTACKRRLLLVNIFFPPQTVGGSTRVVRDNLDWFLESEFAERCDFAVVTGDAANPNTHALRVDDYRGVPVFRIATPIDARMEWRHRDDEVGELFERILDMFEPSIVHFHAVQRLTLSTAIACLKRNIPYIVTIHDGWWVSDYMFMTDERGRERRPAEEIPLEPPYEASVGEAIERRRQLRCVLESSQRVLAVSDAFTSLMRGAGYPGCLSVPNGVSPMKAVPRPPGRSGKVRVAQISGFTHHKGFHLVQAAFRSGRYSNIVLTVLDHWRFGGRTEVYQWGETEVRIVGKTRQEDMHDFYAEQDVLLVPSVWPESFGLVAREAAEAGLWVVASDRGAIGDSVVHGQNGWVVSVDTLEPFARALQEINDDPAKYGSPPPKAEQPLRTAGDQARELMSFYDEILESPIRAGDLPYFVRHELAAQTRTQSDIIKSAQKRIASLQVVP